MRSVRDHSSAIHSKGPVNTRATDETSMCVCSRSGFPMVRRRQLVLGPDLRSAIRNPRRREGHYPRTEMDLACAQQSEPPARESPIAAEHEGVANRLSGVGTAFVQPCPGKAETDRAKKSLPRVPAPFCTRCACTIRCTANPSHPGRVGSFLASVEPGPVRGPRDRSRGRRAHELKCGILPQWAKVHPSR
jgi:hypothetical protein